MDQEFSEYKEVGLAVFRKNEATIRSRIADFKLPDGTLDGSKMQANWFPPIEADIFISHSHKDEKMAIGLAGWLHSKFKLTVFIDSCIWKFSGDLQRMIDNEYCWNEDHTFYNYALRNLSTSHVHMMLSTALTTMIDATECFIFLNTQNSVPSKSVVEKTNSPWLYSELAVSKLIRQKPIVEYRSRKVTSKYAKLYEDLKVGYRLDLDHLTKLTTQDLLKWGRMQNGHPHALDSLYALKN